MVRKEKRAIGTVWVFRWSEEVNGQRRQHKDVIGTTKQFPTEAAANKEADRRRCRLNENKQYLSLKAITFGELINHYLNHELPRLSKSARKANKSYIKNWIEPNWHGRVAGSMKTMQIQEWLDKIQRPDGTKLKIKNVLSAIFSHGVRWELVERNPVCGQGGSPGHRGASTGVRQSNRVSIQRVTLAPDVVRQTLEQLPLREATMALVDAVTALRASELVALKWKNVGWETGILQSEFALVEGELKETKSRNNPLPLAESCLQVLRLWRENTAYRIGRGLDLCQSALSWQDSIHLSNSLPTPHSSRDRESLRNQEQQGSADRMAHATPITSDIADLERGECEGRTVTASSHNPKDYPGALRTSGFSRSAGSPQEGRPDGASGGIPREIEGAERYRNSVETRVSLALGVRGCPKSTLPKSAKYFEILVSAAGFEPATHALKGHCSTN